jgi:Flp pilus assembly protein protease CpaA
VIHICLAFEHLHDLLDMTCSSSLSVRTLLLVSFLNSPLASMNWVVVSFVFGQHQNVHGDGGAVKKVGASETVST